jgi:hypothetical protein
MGDGIKMEMWRTTRGGHFLRGPSGAIGSSTTSKQVNLHLVENGEDDSLPKAYLQS